MCYPKPGPRCSAHAALALAKATHEKNTSERGSDAYFAACEREEQAKLEFDITPAGLKVLQDQHRTSILGGVSIYNDRYERAVRIRAERLKAVKHLKQVQHQIPAMSQKTLPPAEFLAADAPREDREPEVVHEEVAAAATPWMMELSDDELQQVRWMTGLGSVEANTHIAGTNKYLDAVSAEEIEERMQFVDSALSKFQSDAPRIVYRGVRAVSVPGGKGRDYWTSEEEKQKLFLEGYEEGSVVSSPFYMPTSSEPSTADMFSDFGVVLEMRTSRAAPVSEISSRPKETEWLLPRDAKFRVVAVHRNVLVDGSERTVVQLDEVH